VVKKQAAGVHGPDDRTAKLDDPVIISICPVVVVVDHYLCVCGRREFSSKATGAAALMDVDASPVPSTCRPGRGHAGSARTRPYLAWLGLTMPGCPWKNDVKQCTSLIYRARWKNGKSAAVGGVHCFTLRPGSAFSFHHIFCFWPWTNWKNGPEYVAS